MKNRLVGFPFWRINVGNTLGVCLIPIVILGFVPLFFALKPSGIYLALITTGLLCYVFGIGPAGHVLTVTMGILGRASDELDDKSKEEKGIENVLNEQKKIFIGLSVILYTTYFIGSLFYSILVLTGKTNLPVWMALINPFILTIVSSISYRWAPHAIAGYLLPICMYVGVTPLQILTLIYMWNVT